MNDARGYARNEDQLQLSKEQKDKPIAVIQELREEIRRLSSKIEMLQISYYTMKTCVFGVFLFCLVINMIQMIHQ